MAGKVFISYSSADQETADKLVGEIERRGISCWISSRDIRPGEDYQKAIVVALKDAAVFLLLFTENANKSSEIPHELALAGKYKKTVIPARVQDIVPSEAFAYQMTSSQFIDLFHDFNTKVNELCIRLAELLQISDAVNERIRVETQRRLEQERRAKFVHKLKRVALVAAAIAIAVGGAVAWLQLKRHNPSTTTPGAVASAPVAPSPVASSPIAAQSGESQNIAPIPSAVVVATPPPQAPISVSAPPEATPTAAPSPSAPPVAVSAPPPAASPTPAFQQIPDVVAPAPAVPSASYTLSQDFTLGYAKAVRDALAQLATNSPFAAGKYVDGNGLIYTVSGPGVSIPGQTAWSISLDQGPDVRRNYEATWTTGPPDKNPETMHLPDLDSIPAGYSYGFENVNGNLQLVGARSLGGAIELATLADNGGWRTISTVTISPQPSP